MQRVAVVGVVDQFPAPFAALVQGGPHAGFGVGVRPLPGANVGEAATQHLAGADAVLALGGGVEESDALLEVGGDDRIADLREHVAEEAALLGVGGLEGGDLRAGGAFHHARIHRAGADRAKHLFRLLQPRAQLRVFGAEGIVSGRFRGHGVGRGVERCETLLTRRRAPVCSPTPRTIGHAGGYSIEPPPRGLPRTSFS